MLRTIIISPDTALARRLEHTLQTLDAGVAVARTLDRYPAAVDLGRALRAHAPEAVFLSFEDVARAAETVKSLETEARGLQIIAVNQVCDAPLLRESMRLGVREFLVDPFERQSLLDALHNVEILLERNPPVYDATDQVLAFLPSKAGVGTTTLALNMSAALARRKGSRVVLTDLDLNSGMLRFLLKLTNEYSVVDAVENAARLDETLWNQLVTRFGDLDVLHAGPVNPNLRIEPAQIRDLIQFMRRNYGAVCFDLSGNLERYSIEVMQEAKRVILVCTPEIPSLHLAREKLAFIRSQGFDSRVSVVLNRVPRRPLVGTPQVEEVLNVKVAGVFGNDYHAVTRATTAGGYLAPETAIAKQCSDFVNAVLHRPLNPPGERKRKFLEYFTVPHEMVTTQSRRSDPAA